MAPAFANVPRETWRAHAARIWREGPEGLELRYDPGLRDAMLAAETDGMPDLWPLFDAFGDKPLALIRGANSDLLGAATAAEMRRRRPDMLFADVPDRGHVPFLDEPESRGVISAYLDRVTGARPEGTA
jgi:pimeloyl-ACP methyl ester carboxylesterase